LLKTLVVTVVIFLISTAVSFAAPEVNMQEGKWEITTKMEIPAMPMDMPPMKNTTCLTKKDFIPQNSQQGECKIDQPKVAGNKVTWTMRCSGGHGGDMEGTGEIIYSGNTLKGTVRMKNTQSNSEVTSHLTGRRIGECK
jgi:hypothetical protein